MTSKKSEPLPKLLHCTHSINEKTIMGGKAVNDVRSLTQEEVLSTYSWVVENLLPLIGVSRVDATPIGSFGKKPNDQKSGDIDVAINSTIFSPLKFEEVAPAINYILKEDHGFQTTLLKGFDQVSVRVPISGNPANGYAQVDLMPTPSLEWAKFMYHSPNLAEGESNYKGAVRNALLMAIISETTKTGVKLFEGKVEEYESMSIRFPTGMWRIKRNFMGTKGVVQKGKILEAKLVTNSPRDIVDLALGKGYGLAATNSFETIWEVIHRRTYEHKSKLNEIMSKFRVNLKSMMQEVPLEAIQKYPSIFEDISLLRPKTNDEILDAIKRINSDKEFLSAYEKGALNNISADDLRPILMRIIPTVDNVLFMSAIQPLLVELSIPRDLIRETIVRCTEKGWYRESPLKAFPEIFKAYFDPKEIMTLRVLFDFNKLKESNWSYFKTHEVETPLTSKELNKIKEDLNKWKDRSRVEMIMGIFMEYTGQRTLQAVVEKLASSNNLEVAVESLAILDAHPDSSYTKTFIDYTIRVATSNVGTGLPRSSWKLTVGKQWGIEWVDNLVKKGVFDLKKVGRTMYIVNAERPLDQEYNRIHKERFRAELVNRILAADLGYEYGVITKK